MIKNLLLAGVAFSILSFGFESLAGTNDVREAQIQGTLMQIFPDGTHRHWPEDYVHPRPKDPEPFEWIIDLDQNTGDFDNSVLSKLKDDVIEDLRIGNILITSYFDFDKAELKESTKEALVDYAVFLKENGATKVLVHGHTDSKGTDQYNYVLGYRRALSVHRFLLEQGVNAEFKLVSFGETKPALNLGDEYRFLLNRRVVVTGVFE